MLSTTASGASTGDSSGCSGDHTQGKQKRKVTVQQKNAVLRIRRCNATAFYDILDLETVKMTCTDSDIKAAYRKQSLLTHPDKNGHEHADEAFKMVSRAFGILGDKTKRGEYDWFGGDPDDRFCSTQAQNPFSGFSRTEPSGAAGDGSFGGRPFSGEGKQHREFADRAGFHASPQSGDARPRRRPGDAHHNDLEQLKDQLIKSLLAIFIMCLLVTIAEQSRDGRAQGAFLCQPERRLVV